MNMNLGIRKMVVGGVAALAVAGGAITSCNSMQKEKEEKAIVEQLIASDKEVAEARAAYAKAIVQYKNDSINKVRAHRVAKMLKNTLLGNTVHDYDFKMTNKAIDSKVREICAKEQYINAKKRPVQEQLEKTIKNLIEHSKK